jgi:DNA-damage-inducible protein D
MENQVTVFEQKNIRRTEHNGEVYFSIVDIIGILTDSPTPRNYWAMLKKRESQLLTICEQLKMFATDGKQRLTDCANTEGVLRLIQSVPSPKAEPFKMWLAQVGKQKMEEIVDPELGYAHLRELYTAKGYSEKWIDARLKSIGIRKDLTDEWQTRGVKEGQEYAILTAEIARATFGLTPSEHSQVKGLTNQNLRDHMTNIELVFTMLGEESSRLLAIDHDAQGFEENRETAQLGGNIAGKARQNLEKLRGKPVVSPTNFLETREEEDSDKIE